MDPDRTVKDTDKITYSEISSFFLVKLWKRNNQWMCIRYAVVLITLLQICLVALSSVFPARRNTNHTVQPLWQDRGLKCRIQRENTMDPAKIKRADPSSRERSCSVSLVFAYALSCAAQLFEYRGKTEKWTIPCTL